MFYTKMTNRAMSLCYEAHRDQVDKAGCPYVFHPYHLAEQMPDEPTTIVALLHDVVEDSAFSLYDLRHDYGFSEEILEAVSLLTHSRDIPYMDYIESLKKNSLARTVKLADLRHNSDLTRLGEWVNEEDVRRCEKYKKAIRILEEAEEEETDCHKEEA